MPVRLFNNDFPKLFGVGLFLLGLNLGCSSWTGWKPSLTNHAVAVSSSKSLGSSDTQPNTFQAQIDLALAEAEQHEAKGDYREASKMYHEILALHKKNSLAHHRLALIACRLSDSKQAQEHFDHAIRLSPKDNEIIADYAYWHYLNQNDRLATTLIDDGLKWTPSYDRFHGIKGLILARERQFEQSVESFVLAGCSVPQAWSNIGHVLLFDGDTQTAEYWLDHAAEGRQGSESAKKTKGLLRATYHAAE
jgi:Flp pilus assembly protein TadD